jgi:hypothetical protein
MRRERMKRRSQAEEGKEKRRERDWERERCD